MNVQPALFDLPVQPRRSDPEPDDVWEAILYLRSTGKHVYRAGRDTHLVDGARVTVPELLQMAWRRPAKTKALAAVPAVGADHLAVLRSVELLHVRSHAIDAVGHDRNSSTLVVRFKNLVRYAYLEVPREKFFAMVKAESPLTYLQTTIMPRHTCERIDAVPERKPTPRRRRPK